MLQITSDRFDWPKNELATGTTKFILPNP